MISLVLALILSAPHSNLQVFFQSNLASASYQRAVFDKVGRQWVAPSKKPPLGKKAVVQAVIARDGSLLSTSVSMESGSKEWDAAAERAVKRAAPFTPLPKDFTAPSVEVHFHLGWEP